jgi:hypothetical protein
LQTNLFLRNEYLQVLLMLTLVSMMVLCAWLWLNVCYYALKTYLFLLFLLSNLQVLMMPTLVLAARLCPVGVEGTLYASLMSINNFAAGTSDALGAIMMKFFGITSSSFVHLTALLLTCNLLSLLPLPLIGWVPDETATVAAASAAASKGATAAGDSAELGAVSLTVRAAGVGHRGGSSSSSSAGLLASPRQRGSSGGASNKSYHRVSEVEDADWGEKHS